MSVFQYMLKGIECVNVKGLLINAIKGCNRVVIVNEALLQCVNLACLVCRLLLLLASFSVVSI